MENEKIIKTYSPYNEETHKKVLGVNKDKDGNEFIYQPERSKREDKVNLRLKCPNCHFEWEKDVNPIEDEIGLCPQCLL